MIPFLLVSAVLFVAFANGANDNFKGVATLMGSGAATYRRALGWATLTTAAGSLGSLVMGTHLLRTFSGKGLVPDAVTMDLKFLVGVAGGAGLAVLLATRMGLPVSTTHALVGGLVGAALASGSELHLQSLGRNYLIPLIAAPGVAILLTLAVYLPLKGARRFLRLEKETCLCVGGRQEVVDLRGDGTALLRSTGAALEVGELPACRTRYAGEVLGVSAHQLLNAAHFVSTGATSFARGLNDTPKIVALLVASQGLGLRGWVPTVAVVMAVGGVLGARRVAQTLSHGVTEMNEGQGFSANLATAFLVIFASRLGLPVSTTHVSVGALFGVGIANGQARLASIASILTAWVTTLPLAGLLAYGIHRMVSSV